MINLFTLKKILTPKELKNVLGGSGDDDDCDCSTGNYVFYRLAGDGCYYDGCYEPDGTLCYFSLISCTAQP